MGFLHLAISSWRLHLQMISSTEALQGGAILSLSEYLSRPARMKLVKAIHSALEFEINEKKRINRRSGAHIGRDHPSRVLGDLLGVHTSTIWRWVTGGFQACNINAEKVILLAFKHCPEIAVQILYEDLEIHKFNFEKMVDELSQGGARVLEAEVVA